jgi:hypothetical protein
VKENSQTFCDEGDEQRWETVDAALDAGAAR